METGRNDPCPCGSGKKYKRCCLGGLSVEEKQRQSRITTAVTVVVVAAIAVALLVSNLGGVITGVGGLALVGVWIWLSAPPPKSGSGGDPGAINFGR